MQIRIAAPADAEAVERVRIRGWQTAYRDVFPPAELDALEIDPSRFVRPADGVTTYVAAGDGGLVGFVTIGPSAEEAGTGELKALYVDPDSWSLGVGQALLAFGEARLAAAHREATLWVLERNERARRFYEQAGWREDGARDRIERLGTPAVHLRYRKAFSSSAS